MGGWNATGIYRNLGESYSYEPRDFFVFAEGEDETVVLSVTPMKRLVTIERAEWVALTKAGADGKSATEGFTITAREPMGHGGQWRVSEEKKTFGEWGPVEPEE